MRAKALAVLFLLVVGCGDDSDSSDGGAGTAAGGGGMSGGAGGGGTGGRDTLPGPDGGPGGDAAVMPGEMLEGEGCRTIDDCALADGEQLTCVEVNAGFGICARGCTDDTRCEIDEVCDSPYTGLIQHAHCINLVNEEFAPCGGGFTALCSAEAGLSCFLYPDVPLGVCMTPCVSEADDAGVDDSGMCKSEQDCVTSVIDDDETTPEGVCGVVAARGDDCGSDTGVFCGDEDICAPDDPAAATPVLTCHQRCTRADDPCDEGTCQAVRTTFYCR
jgi:hypothetical protein